MPSINEELQLLDEAIESITAMPRTPLESDLRGFQGAMLKHYRRFQATAARLPINEQELYERVVMTLMVDVVLWAEARASLSVALRSVAADVIASRNYR